MGEDKVEHKPMPVITPWMAMYFPRSASVEYAILRYPLVDHNQPAENPRMMPEKMGNQVWPVAS